MFFAVWAPNGHQIRFNFFGHLGLSTGGNRVVGLDWFKHYNTASDGHLIGNLIAGKRYDAIALWWIVLEFISRFESPEQRGECTVPLARLARAVNMKQTRTEQLLTHIAFVSQSDLICEMTAEKPRNVTLRLRNWSNLQENRGGKKRAKSEQNTGRGKKEEVRGEIENQNSPPPGQNSDPKKVLPFVQPPSDSATFEARFHPDFENFKILCSEEGLLSSPMFETRLSTIFAAFGSDLEKIRKFAKQVKTSNAYKTGDEDARTRYLRAALLSESGVA